MWKSALNTPFNDISVAKYVNLIYYYIYNTYLCVFGIIKGVVLYQTNVGRLDRSIDRYIDG
jgi:hypothetical protein